MTKPPACPADAAPTRCGRCGVDEREHMQRWAAPAAPAGGWHTWKAPTQHRIKARMIARRAYRLAARAARAGTQFHATAWWTGSHIPDDEGVMVCADCHQEDCPRFLRTQRRLDRARWGRPTRRGTPLFGEDTMPTITFEKVEQPASKTTKCVECKTRVRRQTTITQTINPYNRNAAGQVKTRKEIHAELAVKAKEWQDAPAWCTPCRQATHIRRGELAVGDIIRAEDGQETPVVSIDRPDSRTTIINAGTDSEIETTAWTLVIRMRPDGSS